MRAESKADVSEEVIADVVEKVRTEVGADLRRGKKGPSLEGKESRGGTLVLQIEIGNRF
jgi:hypothetical protein